MDRTVKDAIARAPMVIVGGGDGSLSSNVDYFVGTDTVFAFLPLGTANSFARTLGMPLDLDGAIDVIANGRRAADRPRHASTATISSMPPRSACRPLIADSVPHGLKSMLGRSAICCGRAGRRQVPRRSG